MTCIAVIKGRDKLWFGADSRLSDGDNLFYTSILPKIINNNGYVMAGAGNAMICDKVMFEFLPQSLPTSLAREVEKRPSPPLLADLTYHMQSDFMKQLLMFLEAEQFVDTGRKKLNFGEGDDDTAEILIGVHKQLFRLSLDTNAIYITPIITPFAVGCGYQYALGSLYTTSKIKMPVKQRLKLAIEAAGEYNSGCDKNLVICST